MNKSFWIIIGVLALLFLGLSIWVSNNPVSQWDIDNAKIIQSYGGTENQTIINICKAISVFGNFWVAGAMMIALALYYFVKKNKWMSLFALALTVPSGVNAIVKMAVDRPRPTTFYVNVLASEIDPSFPSGHVVFYTVFFGFLLMTIMINNHISNGIKIVAGIVLAFLILSIGFSRIYLGVHWPTDVIGGYIFGLMGLMVMWGQFIKYHKLLLK